MSSDKLTLIFGDNPPADVNSDDPEQLRATISASAAAGLPHVQVTLRAVVARQILTDDPPAVWETAQRLLALGMDRESVLGELVFAFSPVAMAEMDLEGHEAGPMPDYQALVQQLPLPDPDEIRRLIRAKVAGGPSLSADALVADVLEALKRDSPSLAEDLIETVFEELLDSDELALTPGDVVVMPASLCQDLVLTGRVPAPGKWPLETDFAVSRTSLARSLTRRWTRPKASSSSPSTRANRFWWKKHPRSRSSRRTSPR